MKRGTEYITKLGLENGHNAVKTIAAPLIEVSGDEEIINVALRNAGRYSKAYGKQYRIMVFILKKDDTGFLMFNDDGGVKVAGPLPVADMKEFAQENIELADYICFAEVGNNLYTVVTLDD